MFGHMKAISFCALGFSLHITAPCGINLKLLYAEFDLRLSLLGFYPFPFPILLLFTILLVFHGNTQTLIACESLT